MTDVILRISPFSPPQTKMTLYSTLAEQYYISLNNTITMELKNILCEYKDPYFKRQASDDPPASSWCLYWLFSPSSCTSFQVPQMKKKKNLVKDFTLLILILNTIMTGRMKMFLWSWFFLHFRYKGVRNSI